MSKSRRSIFASLIGVAAALILGGCVTAGPTRLHILTPVIAPQTSLPAQTGQGEKRLNVVIEDIRLPQYLDRPQILSRDQDNRLKMSEFDQWGGHLGEDMVRVLAMNLGKALGGGQVYAAPARIPAPPDYRLEVDILSFEKQPDGRVGLTAQWRISGGKEGRYLCSDGKTFTGAVLRDGIPYEQLVNSMSLVYGELAQAIAASIRQCPAAGS